MRIGLDFDNTLVQYDGLFHRLAEKDGLIGKGVAVHKTSVRDEVRRSSDDGELAWQRLQAAAYGPMIGEASCYPGVAEFLESVSLRQNHLFVVSHKSRFAAADPDGCDLREAATGWMRRQGFFDRKWLAPADVFYCDTRDEKVSRIAALDLDWFVDDLIDVFDHKAWPARTRRILFDAKPPQSLSPEIVLCSDWRTISTTVLGRP